MSRDLLLMRAGKAQKPGTLGQEPRELTDRGKRGAQKTGVWLLENALRPGVVASSPEDHARTTAEKLLKAAGLSAQDIRTDDRLCGAELQEVLAVLAELPNSPQPTLLVCNKVVVARLQQHLLGYTLETVAPGVLYRLGLPEDWSSLPSNSAVLLDVVRPKDLPKDFPFIGPEGPERRRRPAYYYSQSAVLPYRSEPHDLEVLLITSSKNTHWSIPKGIHEPGLSATESAAIEAMEEAGVSGVVDPSCIGTFYQSKWGARCRVDVFPMEVQCQIAQENWQENHRRRRWLRVSEAMVLLQDNPDLRAIVCRFSEWHDLQHC